MTVIADSEAIYALYDLDDAHHSAVRKVVAEEVGAIILPVAILAELDYLLEEFLGVDAELGFLQDIIRGAYTLDSLAPHDIERCREIIATYRDLKPGLADAAVVATAEKLQIDRILTVDERDFRGLRAQENNPFTLLPAEAD